MKGGDGKRPDDPVRVVILLNGCGEQSGDTDPITAHFDRLLSPLSIKVASNIVDCPDGEITCDMPVRVVFDDVTDEITLPRFTPV